MIHNKWSDTKPEFTEECILITASKIKMPLSEHWDYVLFEIKLLEGEDDKGNLGYYWGICCSDGEEWGDLADLTANKYYTMPLLK